MEVVHNSDGMIKGFSNFNFFWIFCKFFIFFINKILKYNFLVGDKKNNLEFKL